ncbi:hypothetical protein VIBNISO65_110070 [Vibrio nigripulchritudo SO65]|nr:hypothetical protein VIBNIAM115_480062 [Vibrio nigripulchritudo AM115]CCN74499.1 hypothetical protein VIBNISO65_110070 [Vibrio nigripulchritudo SO65]
MSPLLYMVAAKFHSPYLGKKPLYVNHFDFQEILLDLHQLL